MNRRAAGALVATVIGMSTLTWAAPASADLTTRCVGEGGAVTVPGNLVVPAGESCTLTGTVVQGEVRLGAGADLVAEDVTVHGRVVVGRDAYLEAIGSTIDGEVALSGAFGGYLASSTVGDRVRSVPGAGTGALLYLTDVDVAGDLRSTGDEVLLESSSVTGNLVTTDSRYTDLYASFVDGKFSVTGSELGSIVCGSAVQGAARFSSNADAIEIGIDTPAGTCGSGGYWGGTVTADGNTGGVDIDAAIVNGDVVFRDNDPIARVGDDVVVRGTVRGDHESLPDAVPARSAAPGASADRTDAVQERLAQRGTAAEKAAGRAGIVALG